MVRGLVQDAGTLLPRASTYSIPRCRTTFNDRQLQPAPEVVRGPVLTSGQMYLVRVLEYSSLNSSVLCSLTYLGTYYIILYYIITVHMVRYSVFGSSPPLEAAKVCEVF